MNLVSFSLSTSVLFKDKDGTDGQKMFLSASLVEERCPDTGLGLVQSFSDKAS